MSAPRIEWASGREPGDVLAGDLRVDDVAAAFLGDEARRAAELLGSALPKGVTFVDGPGGALFALKLGRTRPLRARLASLGLGRTRSSRALQLASHLLGHDVATARPVAAITGSGWDALFTEAVDATPFDELLEAESPLVEPATHAAADAIARMHAAGVRHRDLKASNVLVDGTGERVWIMDLDGARRVSRGPSLAGRARDVGRLVTSYFAVGLRPHALLEAYSNAARLDPGVREALGVGATAYAQRKIARNATRGLPVA